MQEPFGLCKQKRVDGVHQEGLQYTQVRIHLHSASSHHILRSQMEWQDPRSTQIKNGWKNYQERSFEKDSYDPEENIVFILF